MTHERRRLYLIDGNSYIYRAFHAIRNLSNSRGFPTNAIYGFATMLLKIVREEQPDYLAVAFDTKGPTTRHAYFPRYKATRPPMPEGLVPQIPVIWDLVRAYRIPVIQQQGIEADDLLAAAARAGLEHDLDVVLVSGDKDLLQLVGPHVVVLDTMKEQCWTPEEVEKRYGIGPERLVQMMALMGDAIDNVPGVRGVGEKTAIELVKQFGTLEELYGRIDEVKGARRKALEAGREDAFLSRRLVTLDAEVPFGASLEELRPREPDTAAALAIFKEMEFSRLVRELGAGDAESAHASAGDEAAGHRPHPARPARDYRLVFTREELDALAGLLRDSGGFAVDLETTSLEPLRADIVGLSFSAAPHTAWYVPVGHRYLGVPAQLPLHVVLAALGPLLVDPALPKYGQNIKYDALVLAHAGIELAGIGFDTMVASYVINPTRHQHNLTELALEYLGEQVTTYKDVAGSGKKQISFAEVEVGKARDYSGEDADVAFRLTKLLAPKIEELGFHALYFDLELPLVAVLARMERNGVCIDSQRLRDGSKEADLQLQDLMHRIWAIAGVEFNINSPKQLGEVLFDKLGLPVVRRTKTGRSTDEDVLTRLAASHELPAEILAWRSLAKLKNTYLDVLPTLVNPETGRVHTSFNQTVTATGRLSSSDPNLQNIPVRTELGRRIRESFTAAPGSILVSADYSQIELRIMAHLSGDAELVDSFRRGEDIHARTAALMFGGEAAAVTGEQRRAAKAINFGIIYGMGAYGLSQQLGIDQKQAKEFIERYFERYPGVRVWLDRTIEEARRAGYVETLLGRRRYLPEITSTNRSVAQFAERMAINTPVQGTAADMIKQAMLAIDHELEKGQLMVLQIHDELLFEVPEGEADRLVAMVREKMEGVMRLAVPVRVDVGTGMNWAEAH
ncbi:MAG: DNA polymerase I [Candidatus Methylomirabilia bacterium]